MKQIRIPFLIVVFSMMLVSSAFSLDIADITTIAAAVGGPGLAGLAVLGDGGGLPGLGDALIGQYYDVRPLVNPGTPEGAVPAPPGIATTQFTLLCIVNTDPVNAIVARLRFREWMRSREVLDLDIPLTSNDVWCGVVSRLAAGGASLWSPDRYVTNIVDTCPPGAIAFTTSAFPAAGIPFRTFLIEAAEANPLARTEYGYFEIFGEENVGIGVNNTFTRLAIVGGVNRNVGNVLMGTTYLVRPEVATSHQYNMTAIANFSLDPCGIWRDPGTEAPNFLTEVQGGGGGVCGGLLNIGTGGFDNLEGLLSKRWLDFQFVVGLDPADISQTPTYTTVGVLFPTKHFHYSRVTPFPWLGVTCPFGTPFTSLRETVPGEVVTFSIWNRAEVPLIPPTDPISPSPGGDCTNLPWELNLIGLYPVDPGPAAPIFRNNIVVKTANAGSGQTFYNGWGEIDLSPRQISAACDVRLVTGPQGENIPNQPVVPWGWFNFFNNFFTAYRGLPTLAFVMTEFFNDSVNGYYGNTVSAQFGVDWRLNPVNGLLPW